MIKSKINEKTRTVVSIENSFTVNLQADHDDEWNGNPPRRTVNFLHCVEHRLPMPAVMFLDRRPSFIPAASLSKLNGMQTKSRLKGMQIC